MKYEVTFTNTAESSLWPPRPPAILLNKFLYYIIAFDKCDFTTHHVIGYQHNLLLLKVIFYEYVMLDTLIKGLQ